MLVVDFDKEACVEGLVYRICPLVPSKRTQELIAALDPGEDVSKSRSNHSGASLLVFFWQTELFPCGLINRAENIGLTLKLFY